MSNSQKDRQPIKMYIGGVKKKLNSSGYEYILRYTNELLCENIQNVDKTGKIGV